jgi:dihydropyrimidinase
MGILIKNGTILTADGQKNGDIHCREGRIVAVGTGLEGDPGDEVVDASGAYILPGGIDPHVHLELPVSGTVSSDDFETGTAAALAGGTTTVIDFVHPERGQDWMEALRARREEAAKAVADYGLHMGITWWGEGTAEALRRCVREEGIPTFKAYMAYKSTVGIEDGDLIRAMEAVAAEGALLMVHAEHGDMVEHLRGKLAAAGWLDPSAHPRSRPAEVEGEAVARATMLAGLTGARLYVVHVTCGDSVRGILDARARGWDVHAETCPHYLVLDDSVYDRPGFEAAPFVLTPPLRSRGEHDALWDAIETGAISVVSTDHCPFHTQGQKDLGREDFRKIPNGAAGVEHRLSLLHTVGVVPGRISLTRFVDLVSVRPAKLFGLYPRKGAIEVGSDADLVVFDPAATGVISARTHHHRCDTSIYEGMEVTGLPRITVAGGVVRWRDGDLRVERGAGRYVERNPSAAPGGS